MNINRRKFLTIMGAVPIAASLPALAVPTPKVVQGIQFTPDKKLWYKSSDIVKDDDWLMVVNKETVKTPPRPVNSNDWGEITGVEADQLDYICDVLGGQDHHMVDGKITITGGDADKVYRVKFHESEAGRVHKLSDNDFLKMAYSHD